MRKLYIKTGFCFDVSPPSTFWLLSTGLTLEQALSIAESNSPAMKKTRLNLIRSQENLNAQNAALKSQFSLSVNPIGYSQNRSFNDLISKWNSVKTTESYGLFTIAQPIVLTDARLSLINRFGYRDSYSEYANSTKRDSATIYRLISTSHFSHTTVQS